ncbi:ATPase AAA+ type core [Macrophomina phaseolina MS6]|uniref:ATP-dependent DNA helicase PIF1 n=1 Tax=Macrophomina phaseolina (strain MS6) TaxID=1126212 RepID=K2SUW1_MACPH|nr:ATPase AAA+ type core [Macrophomina phaseolina MS6]
MFKKAVDSHNASSRPTKPSLSQKLFPGTTPSQQAAKLAQATINPSATRPLVTTTGNTARAGASTQTSGGSHSVRNGTGGLKRTASGLMKVLDSQPAFADEDMPKNGSQKNPYIVSDVSPATKTAAPPANTTPVYFDENDFDDDLDLDIEDPSVKSTAKYPSLASRETPMAKPASLPKPQLLPSIQDFNSRPLKEEESNRFRRADSGYYSQRPTVQPEVKRGPPEATQQIPWSSSPPEHLQARPQAAALKRFMYSGIEDSEDRPKPPKRRTLPWAEGQNKEEAAAKNENGTPKESKFPWNTSSSTIKQMQKSHREVNKKLTKSSSTGASGLIADSLRTKKSKLSRVFLSEEQQHVLNLVVNEGKSVFFTGSAGTGKSVLLREIIAALKRKYMRESERVAVTASTGLAACNIGGVTLHSFSGIGLGNQPTEELIKKIKRNQKHKHRWMRVKVLVIDEVSMIDGDLFDKLESIARSLRNNGRPFGGIQLVITGDFFQLPPVPEKNKVAKFAFDANTWNTVIEHTIGLTHIFRQKDPVFAGMLNEMREGRLSQSSIDAFRKLNRPLESESGLEATELFPLRQQVEEANRRRMAILHGDVRTYEAKDGGTMVDKAQRDKFLQNCMAPEAIQLKKGAQVMLIKNMDETLVNGSLGRVIGFMNEAMFDSYQQNEEQYLGTAAADTDDPEERMLLEQKRRARITDLLNSGPQLYPVVRFTLPDGTMRDLLCQRESWKNELPNGEVIASRSQVPLILAWALSIHKAQGQTLERVKVDLGKVFEKGQAYVALSRATSMAGLQVLNFDPRKVVAHDKVRSFYEKLSKAPVGDFVEKKSKKRGMTAEEYEKTIVEDGWADDGGEFAYGG